MGRTSTLAVLAVTAAIVLAPDAVWAQCAMCRSALQSPEGQHMAAAFRSGILVLLAAPFSLVAVVATLIVRMARRRSFERF